MTEVYKRITVDLARRSNVRLVFARQNDIGSRNLLITLTNGGMSYIPEVGSSATLNFKRSDEVCGAVAATILRTGDIAVQLPQIVLGAAGETVCSVSLFDSKKNKLTSSDFYLDVGEEFYVGETVDDNPDYSLLQSLFAKMAEYAAAERNRDLAENNRQKSERERAEAEFIRDAKLVQNLGIGGILTLFSDKWNSDFEQTASVSDLGENDLIEFYPATRIDRAIMTNYKIFLEPGTNGSKVKFIAEAQPVANISLKYFITRGREV